jgi:hypothetical protein
LRVYLRVDDPRPITERNKPLPQTPLAGHLKESHAELPFEAAPHCREVKPEASDIRFAPAMFRPLFKRCEQCRHSRICISHWSQRMTALAGAKPRVQTLSHASEELAILPLGLAGWAGQSAKNPGAGNTDIGLTIETVIPVNKRLIQRIMVR